MPLTACKSKAEEQAEQQASKEKQMQEWRADRRARTEEKWSFHVGYDKFEPQKPPACYATLDKGTHDGTISIYYDPQTGKTSLGDFYLDDFHNNLFVSVWASRKQSCREKSTDDACDVIPTIKGRLILNQGAPTDIAEIPIPDGRVHFPIVPKDADAVQWYRSKTVFMYEYKIVGRQVPGDPYVPYDLQGSGIVDSPDFAIDMLAEKCEAAVRAHAQS